MRARATAFALSLQAVALAHVAPAGAEGPVSHHRGESARRSAIVDYWTPERLRSAEPRDLTAASRVPASGDPLAAASGGKPGFVAPVGPAGAGGGSTPGAGPASDKNRGAAHEVLSFDVPPNTVHGKVFAKDRGGPFQCSASAVASENRSVVFTAGHCVRLDPYGWARKFIFIPSYRERAQPFGTWTWDTFLVPSKWVKRQSSNYDLAAVVLQPRDGVPVQDVVGGVGFAWNQPRTQTYRSFGYPANYFLGERMMACLSAPRRAPDFGRGPRMVGMTCDMGKGSSGGGWLIQDRFLNSVQSLGRRNFSAGPYFGKSARRVYGRAQRQ
jgi:V8-like Glu-specific endopeptidase